MECVETNIPQTPAGKVEVETSDSADDFQKFIYELFDKNGILNDLRAYLRGHIVNVLKNAQTGDIPLCQKHFTQRLELASQALNILIAEYLLRMEFTYTLSVFVSEIPLSNMVFDFAKSLFKGTETSNMKFKENDIWSVLNYLGVQCDSEHATNIVEMYKSEEQTPLLHCILKCMPMYRTDSFGQQEDTSRYSLTSSTNSLDTCEEKRTKVHRNISCHEKCRHFSICKCCQNRVQKLKEKYKKRKERFVKNTAQLNENAFNVENFMKNVNVMEKSIIDEMFEQLKSVYDEEVDMVRQEEENRVKRTLATHALQLQKRKEELEESLKSRQAELESNAQQKKQFLWSVARALRTQHEHVTKAMALVKDEEKVLAEKENNLKHQLKQAEATIRRKGEEMRIQIASELAILEQHLETMKQERDSLNKARSDFEDLKSYCESKTKIIESNAEKETEDMKQHYNQLKEELAALKEYIESTKVEPKCLVEKGTLTDYIEASSSTSILNNTQRVERNQRADNDREARPPNQVLNDLKKQKNVNFSQSNLDEVYRELSRERSRSSVSSEGGASVNEGASDPRRDVIQQLVQENESLKDYARQQREHISALWSERVRRSAATAARPCTAPALPAANFFTVHGVNPSTSANTFGWRKGAGEELSLFPHEPRIVLPGDQIPFLGLVRDRHSDNRRHLINQWRALKRSSPLAGITKLRTHVPIQRDTTRDAQGAGSYSHESSAYPVTQHSMRQEKIAVEIRDETLTEERPGSSSGKLFVPKEKSREKSPKTVLKEAKQKLKNNITKKPPPKKREKSPNAMLRDAKLRLRKLEIEAEAVEKSYLDFRKRQEGLREERKSLSILKDELFTDDIVRNFDRNRSMGIIDDNMHTDIKTPSKETNKLMKNDFDKYLREYQTTFDIGMMVFKNKTTAAEKVKPIPAAYSEVNTKNNKSKPMNVDYLETPLMEFRKLYHVEKERIKANLSSKKPEKPKEFEESRSYNRALIIVEDEPNKKSQLEMTSNEIDEKVEDTRFLKDKGEVEKNIDENLDNPSYSETDKIKIISSETQGIKNINSDVDPNTLNMEETQISSGIIEFTEHNRLDALRGIKNNKAAELELLKENINKIYNLKPSPRSMIRTLDENPNEATVDENIIQNTERPTGNMDRNILRVEVESTCEVNKVKMSDSHDDSLLIVVQSSANTKDSDESEEAIENNPITVIVSPREKGPKDREVERMETPKSVRSNSPEKAAEMMTNDILNAIFLADDKDLSSLDIHQLSNDKIKENASDPDKDEYEDYPDDFSADVDNYNSRSDYGNNSPVSLLKTSEDENFWDN